MIQKLDGSKNEYGWSKSPLPTDDCTPGWFRVGLDGGLALPAGDKMMQFRSEKGLKSSRKYSISHISR